MSVLAPLSNERKRLLRQQLLNQQPHNPVDSAIATVGVACSFLSCHRTVHLWPTVDTLWSAHADRRLQIMNPPVPIVQAANPAVPPVAPAVAPVVNVGVPVAPPVMVPAANPGVPHLPANIPGVGAPSFAARPYRTWYHDHTRDPFIGNYPAIYDNYVLTNANTPAVVRGRIFSNGNSGVPIGHVLLVRHFTAGPDDPGTIQGFHRCVRYEAGLMNPTPFDDVGYAFMGDIHQGQAPHTVVWADDYFNRTNDVQVPTAAYMDQLLAADPALTQVGPFAAGTADTEPVNTRFCMFIPNRYMTLLLDDSMSPRQAWMVIRGAIVADGLAVDCSTLLDWLRVALTRRAVGAVTPLARAVPLTPTIASVTEANTFRQFRAQTVDRDHPNLRTNQVTQGANLVAQGLTDIAEQSRLQRVADEQRRQRETRKTAQDLFPTGLQKLMRWCQAADETQLPPFYTAAARAKKGDRRKVLQDAVNEAMETLGYQHEFPVTTKQANKILDLEWTSRLVDDLTLGLNIFVMGWLAPEEAEDVKFRNSQADALYSGHAAPSLADTAEVLEVSDDVHIPRTLAQLRYSIEYKHAMLHVLLGAQHAWVHDCRAYRHFLVQNETWLEGEIPHTPKYRHLMPALLARCIQIDFNVWLQDQARTDRALPVDTMTDTFNLIKRKRGDWEPHLPPNAFAVILPGGNAPTPQQQVQQLLQQFQSLPAQPQQQPPPQQPPAGDKQAAIRNLNYNDKYLPLKEKGLITKKVKAHCKLTNVPWPTNGKGYPFCPTFHIKGICNTRCGFRDDHVPHTEEEDASLLEWSNQHYRVE